MTRSGAPVSLKAGEPAGELLCQVMAGENGWALFL